MLTRAQYIAIVPLPLALGCVALAQMPSRGGPPPQPPREMLKMCEAKREGAACSGKLSLGGALSGHCHGPSGLPLACLPDNGRGGPPNIGPPNDRDGPPDPGAGAGSAIIDPPPSDQGAPIVSTATDTSSVACNLSGKGTNSSAGLPYQFSWTCASGKRTLRSNGVPNHSIGAFPNSGNPNHIAAQRVEVSTTLRPVARSGAGAFVKDAGYALNGVKFDPGTAQSCTDNCNNHGDSPFGPWRIEALNQSYFKFGIDANHAHVQPGGSYHYHGVPEGMLSAAQRAGKTMALIGWAADGFPIYARFGHTSAKSAESALRPMRSSYQLKSRPDAGRPPTTIAPMGTFTQDYHYVAGRGDLDECNGRFDVTPEFSKGIYHYYATDGYPYIQRCVKGAPAREMDERSGPPPFGLNFGFGPPTGAAH